jgi:hypothetical protein
MHSITQNTFVTKDGNGAVRHIEHIREPFRSPTIAEPSPGQLADEYLGEVAPLYQFAPKALGALEARLEGQPTGEDVQLHRSMVKDVAGSVVVSYAESYRGLPVWGADLSVHIAKGPMRVTSSTNTLPDEIALDNSPEEVAAAADAVLTPEGLSRLLGLAPARGVKKINSRRLVLYRYVPELRLDPEAQEPAAPNVAFEAKLPTLALPRVPESFRAGMHYAAAEVLFDLAVPAWGLLHWRALVEPKAGAVLYLRALVACVSPVTGAIFRMDPISLSGDATLIPAAPAASLNPWRTNLEIPDLNTAAPQPLSGVNVALQDVAAPAYPAPTTSAPYDFSYDTKTAEFAAVNAYYHVNWFLELMEGMGFDLDTYFDGTPRPIPVDHWAENGAVNARCNGNAAGNGTASLVFGVAQSGQTVGIADDLRVVLHELGHALLWDHVDSPNFGWAHSAGDSLAAILLDPESRAPDRFLTFPWPQGGGGPLDRRHDRSVASGWGFFGSMYNTQYAGEQVLSTTLFRIYRSVGGDSPYRADRAWAARYLVYLVIKAIGTLTTTTRDPRVFVTALMNADVTTASFEGHPGGCLHKVIRWSFEKQGLFQAAAVPGGGPVTREGDPPNVDVYVDDGRHGEYPYRLAFWENQDVWVRRKPDGGTTHQTPIVGKPCYFYVRVKNRGLQPATNVVVRGFHCNPGTGLAWPDHWAPMDTPSVAAAAPLPPGGSAVIGPLRWTPETVGHECLLAIVSADGDPANDTTVSGPVAHSRFVPFDNNVAQRNVTTIRVIDWKKLREALKKRVFRVVNPFPKMVEVELRPVLPKVLKEEGVEVVFQNPGSGRFHLGPYASRKIVMSGSGRTPIVPSRAQGAERTKPGILESEVTLGDGAGGLDDGVVKFRVDTLIDGQLMGGMTYLLTPEKGRPSLGGERESASVEARREESRAPSGDAAAAGRVDVAALKATIASQPGVKGVRVRQVCLDVDLEE